MILRTDPAWHGARLGKLTASNMAKAMGFLKGGASSEARRRYLREIVAERLTDIFVPHYVSEAMQWGIDMQATAIEEFESEAGMILAPEALYQHLEIEDFVATPDGTTDDMVIEIKCPETSTHLRYLSEGEIPLDYQYQIAAQILCTGKSGGIFVSFDPRIPSAKRLLIIELRDSAILQKTLDGARKFLDEAQKLFEEVSVC